MTLRAALLLAALLPAAALAEGRSEAFLDLASRIPAEFLDGSGAPDFAQLHFADHEAAAEAMAALPRPEDHVAAHGAFARLSSPLFVQSLAAGSEQGWEPFVGFGRSDIRQSLVVKAPPSEGVVLRLDPAAAQRVGPTLLASGYTEETRDGVAVLARGEDGEFDLAARDPADPFGLGLGSASRVVVEGDLLTQANTWPLMLGLLGTAPQGHPDLPALSQALDDSAWGDARLVQAVLWPDQDELGRPGGVGLPPWTLALAADLADGPNTQTLVLFAYSDRASAETAAAVLRDGWTAAEDASGATLEEITGSPAEVQVLGEGPFVTALALRAPSDTASGGWPVNRPFHRITLTLVQRGLELFGPA